MTPEKIAIVLVKIRWSVANKVIRQYAFFIKMMPLAGPLMFMSLVMIYEKSLLAATLFLVISIFFHSAPRIVIIVAKWIRIRAQRDIKFSINYKNFQENLRLSESPQERAEIKKKMRENRAKDTDLRNGKIIYFILIFLWFSACFTIINYLLEYLLKNMK
ncbi:MAG: hypothetical protein ACOYMB_01900 [Patescibacteria group bacterium]